MYRILVRNRTDHTLSLCGAISIRPGMGRMVAASDDILVADRLVAMTGIAVVLGFAAEDRGRFMVTATEFGCELDHPEFGRISVTIFDPNPCVSVRAALAGDGASAARGA